MGAPEFSAVWRSFSRSFALFCIAGAEFSGSLWAFLALLGAFLRSLALLLPPLALPCAISRYLEIIELQQADNRDISHEARVTPMCPIVHSHFRIPKNERRRVSFSRVQVAVIFANLTSTSRLLQTTCSCLKSKQLVCDTFCLSLCAFSFCSFC